MDEHLLRYEGEKGKTFVFIDCETLNLCLNFCHNLPWQVAMIKTVDGKKIDEKDIYIKWDTKLKISSGAARITKYNPSTIEKRGVPPEEIFPTIQDWLDNADYIVGHNIIGFDIYLIRDYYKKMGKAWKHLMPKIIDTMCLSRGLKMDVPYSASEDFLEYQYKLAHMRTKGVKTNLKAMGKDFSIQHDYDRLHNAIVDLELNLKIWNKLKWTINI